MFNWLDEKPEIVSRKPIKYILKTVIEYVDIKIASLKYSSLAQSQDLFNKYPQNYIYYINQ